MVMNRRIFLIRFIISSLLVFPVFVFAYSPAPYYAFKPLLVSIDGKNSLHFFPITESGANETYVVKDINNKYGSEVLRVISPTIYGQDIIISFNLGDSLHLKLDKPIAQICYYSSALSGNSDQVCGTDIEVKNPTDNRVYIKPAGDFKRVSDTFWFKFQLQDNFNLQREIAKEDPKLAMYLTYLDNGEKKNLENFNVDITWNGRNFALNAANSVDFSRASVERYEQNVKDRVSRLGGNDWLNYGFIAFVIIAVISIIFSFGWLIRKLIARLKSK